MVGQGYGLGESDGELLQFGDVTILVKVAAAASGGAYSLFEERPPMVDTPLHVHAFDDELFYVLEGDHVFRVGDADIPAGPGGLVFARAACRTRSAAWCPGGPAPRPDDAGRAGRVLPRARRRGAGRDARARDARLHLGDLRVTWLA